MANKTKLEQLDVQKITNNGYVVQFDNGLAVPTGTTICTGAAGINEDSSGNVMVNGNNYGVIATRSSENTFTAQNTFTVPQTFNSQVLMPNSPTTPEEAEVIDSYSTRITANADTTGLTVADGSETYVTKIAGATVETDEGLRNAYFKGIESGSKNLLNTKGEKFYVAGDFTFDNGKITSANTSSSATTFLVYSKVYPAGTYTFSAQSLSYSSYRVIIATDTQVDGTAFNQHYTSLVGQNCYFKSVANTEKYFTFTAAAEFKIGMIMYLPATVEDRTCVIDEMQLISGSAQEDYVPYKGDAGFTYDETLELGNWDYALPQEGKVYKSTALYQFTGTETIQNKSEVTTGSYKQECYYYNVILNNPIAHVGASDLGVIAKGIQVKHPDQQTIPDIGIYWGGWSNQPSVVFWSKKSVDYWATVEDLAVWLADSNIGVAYITTETITNISPKASFYLAYPNGYETVDNGGYGADALPTITQTYTIVENPTEAATKAYVNNGLAKKLDKRGGTITGSLIVEGKTDTALGAIVAKEGDVTYGLAYDNDAYKLGQGTIDDNGDFTFNESEGLPITLRDDSSAFTDGNLVSWSSTGNKIVDSNINSANIVTYYQDSVSDYGYKVLQEELVGIRKLNLGTPVAPVSIESLTIDGGDYDSTNIVKISHNGPGGSAEYYLPFGGGTLATREWAQDNIKGEDILNNIDKDYYTITLAQIQNNSLEAGVYGVDPGSSEFGAPVPGTLFVIKHYSLCATTTHIYFDYESNMYVFANGAWEKHGKGDKGDTVVSVSIGSVTTGESGTEASVTNSGTETEAVLNFVIPKGDKGDGVQDKFIVQYSTNLFDMSQLEEGYINTDGTIAANASYKTTGFMPCKAGDTLRNQFDYNGTRFDNEEKPGYLRINFACAYDADKKMISGSWNGDGITSYVCPEGTAFVRFSFENGYFTQTLYSNRAVVVSDVVTPLPYEEYKEQEILKNELIDTEYIGEILEGEVDAYLPKNIYCAVGRTIELYNNQVCLQAERYHLKWDCAIGKALSRKFSVTGVTSQVGTYPLSLTIYDDRLKVKWTGATTLNIVEDVTGSYNVCPIGDSLTNDKDWLGEVINLSSGKINFVGTYSRTIGDANGNWHACGHEGRSGFSAGSYLEAIIYTFGGETEPHAFWDGTRFNWNYYKTNSGVNPDCVQIFLGTNGIKNDNTENVYNIVQMVNYIRQDDANIPIFIVNTIYAGTQNGIGVQQSNDGYASQKGVFKYNEDKKVMNLMKLLDEALDTVGGVHMINLALTHDSEYNFGAVETPVNPRAAQTEFMPTESIHPQPQGYYQMADVIYSVYCAALD